MKKNNRKNIEVRYIIGIAALLCMLVCVVILAAGQYKRWKSENIYNKLAEATTVEEKKEADTEDDTEAAPDSIEGYKREAARLAVKYGIEVPEKNIDFDKLHKEVSEDIYAWIYIPDTNIDYPVFQHPTDNAYYLEHNVDGSEGYPGCIYTENYNSKDFSDPQPQTPASCSQAVHRYAARAQPSSRGSRPTRNRSCCPQPDMSSS